MTYERIMLDSRTGWMKRYVLLHNPTKYKRNADEMNRAGSEKTIATTRPSNMVTNKFTITKVTISCGVIERKGRFGPIRPSHDDHPLSSESRTGMPLSELNPPCPLLHNRAAVQMLVNNRHTSFRASNQLCIRARRLGGIHTMGAVSTTPKRQRSMPSRVSQYIKSGKRRRLVKQCFQNQRTFNDWVRISLVLLSGL